MKGTRLSLDLFRVFSDLAESKSFSKTAGKNYLTQSAISQQLTFLERHFGKILIERGKGRFVLTDEGQRVLEGSREILAVYQEMLDKIQGTDEISGTVIVKTIYSIGLHPLPLYVKTFMRRHAQINLRVEYQRSDRIYSDVLKSTCDLGIVAHPMAHPLLEVVPFHKEKLVLICSPEDPLSHKKKIRLKEVDHRHFIAFEKDIPTRRAVDSILRTHQVYVDIVQEFDNIETLKRAVEVGTGISIVPINTVAQEVTNRTLVAIQLAGGPYWRETGIIYRKDRSLSKATREFIGWLTKGDLGKESS